MFSDKSNSSTAPARLFRWLFVTFSATVFLLAALELALRFDGRPRGAFAFLERGPNGLYPPGRTIEMRWGPIPYLIHTNQFGLRGKEIAATKAPGSIRIGMLGDSVTNGFFVADEETYPALLEESLYKLKIVAEVVNGARGGASIGEEFAQLREVIAPLAPDIAIVTFVTNDVSVLEGAHVGALSRISLKPAALEIFLERLLTKTALVEAAAEALLTYLSKHRIETPPDTDLITEFRRRFSSTDGKILTDNWNAETVQAFSTYLAVLRRMKKFAEERGIRLVLVFVPSYDQLFAHDSSFRIQRELDHACKSLGLLFIDTTTDLARAAQMGSIHLTPIDFHFNREGNAALADSVARQLVDAGALDILITHKPR